ncbi:hypothetical protein Tco_1321761 [Tanacetum coccineum]
MSTDKESSAAGTDNRPPMLVESDYESWKIRIERYIRVQVQEQSGMRITENETIKNKADIQSSNIPQSRAPKHVINILNQTLTGKEI